MTKTFTFAAMHFTIAFGVVYAMTGSLLLGGAVALVEPALNTVAFHFHENAWSNGAVCRPVSTCRRCSAPEPRL